MFALDAIGQPSLGVASGPFGTGLAGGVSAFFGDQLGDQMIGTAIQAQGTVQDIGAQAVYYNLKNRVNWGAGISHIPYLTGFAMVGPSPNSPQLREYSLVLQRLFFSEASVIAQYPFSTTRRVETSLSATRIGYNQEIQSMDFDPITGATGNFRRTTVGGPPPIHFGQASLALVGDWSNAAFTSPVAGGRYRFEAQPTFGEITFNTALADYRRYYFMRPITFAWRGVHYGRYGLDAENYQVISPLFLGEEQLVRGYSYGSFDVNECVVEGQPSQASCPVLERLIGSRMAVFNAELRIPLIGTREFGLLNIPFLPVELSPFFDAGLMWTSDQQPSLRFKRDTEERPTNCSAEALAIGICAERVPVFSTGISARINVLGYLIFETYLAKPFQRPAKDWVWGFQLAPGW